MKSGKHPNIHAFSLAKRRPNATDDPDCGNEQNCDLSPLKENPKRNKSKKRRNMNVVSKQQLNGSSNCAPLPDDLTYRLNEISGDTADANRMFTIILPTKHSHLQLFARDKFFDSRNYEPIEVKHRINYTIIAHFWLFFFAYISIIQFFSFKKIACTRIRKSLN